MSRHRRQINRRRREARARVALKLYGSTVRLLETIHGALVNGYLGLATRHAVEIFKEQLPKIVRGNRSKLAWRRRRAKMRRLRARGVSPIAQWVGDS